MRLLRLPKTDACNRACALRGLLCCQAEAQKQRCSIFGSLGCDCLAIPPQSSGHGETRANTHTFAHTLCTNPLQDFICSVIDLQR